LGQQRKAEDRAAHRLLVGLQELIELDGLCCDSAETERERQRGEADRVRVISSVTALGTHLDRRTESCSSIC
jgi:hypothetical protein